MKRGPDGKTASRHVAEGDGWREAPGATQGLLNEWGTIEIRPEPSPLERVAILTALEQMLGSSRRDNAPRPAVWAFAGRRESMPGGAGSSHAGWGRGKDRLEGW